MSTRAIGIPRILVLSLALAAITLPLAPIAWAESEASLSAGSEASWGGWSSAASRSSSSEATWGGWGSEASRGGYSAASSQASSESGLGLRMPGGFSRRYSRYAGGGGYGGYGAYGSGYDQNEASALQRMRQEQQQEQQHEHSLASMPDSSFVHTYGSAARRGGIVDTYRRQSNPYWNGAASGAAASYVPPVPQPQP
jgi:hypothetical protein